MSDVTMLKLNILKYDSTLSEEKKITKWLPSYSDRNITRNFIGYNRNVR